MVRGEACVGKFLAVSFSLAMRHSNTSTSKDTKGSPIHHHARPILSIVLRLEMSSVV